METEQSCSIFDYEDIADLIFDKLDFETITKVAVVCKLFASISKEHYHKHLKDEIINPARHRYDEFYLHYMNSYISNNYYTFFYKMNVDYFLKILISFETFIDPFINKNFWLLFLYDTDVTENFFLFVSRINHIIQYNKQFIFFDTNIEKEEYNRRTLIYYKINTIFKTLDKYLCVKYPSRYNNSDLHKMARFKKIDKYWCMNKTKLENALHNYFDEK